MSDLLTWFLVVILGGHWLLRATLAPLVVCGFLYGAYVVARDAITDDN